MKYTKDTIEIIAQRCVSFSQLVREFGLKATGNSVTYMRKRCDKLGVDTSHFTGMAHGRGGEKRKVNVLVEHDPNLARITGARLRKALIEAGIEPKCTECGVGEEWNGKPLTLQVDHRDGRYWNNRIENLRFNCPNCHSQTDNYGSKNKALNALRIAG